MAGLRSNDRPTTRLETWILALIYRNYWEISTILDAENTTLHSILACSFTLKVSYPPPPARRQGYVGPSLVAYEIDRCHVGRLSDLIVAPLTKAGNIKMGKQYSQSHISNRQNRTIGGMINTGFIQAGHDFLLRPDGNTCNMGLRDAVWR
ncbi:uncharacterized protein MCYG_05213 [Microsporum canis CBS 113480]|uniref:Uncharacterized protein n=1 Tax=Arthroderma otae (strain ATCC MYA-4605 / CBS 113480) TaxID=554155 RepID=C5FR91_ARTOC|nr:uncharacterized protein MCYG_05213 [Microsporum canis CBS 113480]EEQ32394.1 predicted protein [Microsporum canis CBS 113480]